MAPYLGNLIVISEWFYVYFIPFSPPRKRLTAFREVKPVELANCNLVKGIGKYVREGSILFELAV